MKKKIINGILILLLVITLGITGYLIVDYYFSETDSNYKVNKIVKKINKEEVVVPKKKYVNELPNYRQQYGNDYIFGRLRIPNIQLDTLVTRAEDNKHFLEYNLYNEYDGIGTAIFDYRNTGLTTDKQINIYGHNTDNQEIYDKVPLLKLEAYTDENIFNEAKDIYLDIDEKELHYRLVSVKIIEKTDNEHMYMDFNDDNKRINHINYLLNKSLYRDNSMEITCNDRLLIIQTCNYNPVNTYLLLIAKEINE